MTMTTRRMTSTATETEAQRTHVDDMIDALITSDHIASHRITSARGRRLDCHIVPSSSSATELDGSDRMGWDGMRWMRWMVWDAVPWNGIGSACGH